MAQPTGFHDVNLAAGAAAYVAATQPPPKEQPTTTTTSGFSLKPRFDKDYIRSIPGILKVVQAILCLICLICVGVAGYPGWGPGDFFEFTAGTAIVITLVLLALYLIHLVSWSFFARIPWYMAEMIYCAVTALFYLIGSCLLASNASASISLGAGAFFGFASMIAYGVDAFLKFKDWRAGRRPFEETFTSATTNAQEEPDYTGYPVVA